MIDVKALQVWDVRENEMAPWREAKVKNIRRDDVELQFLDMPNAPYATMIFDASLKRMRSDRKRYRLVREPKRAHSRQPVGQSPNGTGRRQCQRSIPPEASSLMAARSFG